MNPQDLAAFNQAVQLAQAGQKQQAYMQLAGLLNRYPGNKDLLLWLAFTTPNFHEAERAIYDAGRSNPQDPAVSSARDWLAAQRVKQEQEQLRAQAAVVMQVPPLARPAPPKRLTGLQIFLIVFGAVLVLGVVGSVLSQANNTVRTTGTSVTTGTPQEQAFAIAKDTYPKLKSAVIGDSKDTGHTLIVSYDSTTAFDERAFIKTATLDFSQVTPKLFSQLPELNYVRVVEYTDFTDVAGNSNNEIALKLGVSKAVSDKTNWPNARLEKIDLIVPEFYVHPALRKAWTEIQAGK